MLIVNNVEVCHCLVFQRYNEGAYIMLNFPDTLFPFVVLPLIAAQLFLMISIYFTFVGRHVINNVGLFNVFIMTYIIYLLGHGVQMYASTTVAFSVLFVRISLFLTIGLPSLTLFLFRQTGVSLNLKLSSTLYIFGAAMSLVYVICADAKHSQLIFDAYFVELFPVTFMGANHLDAELAAVFLLLLLPTSWLLYKEITGKNSKTSLAFVTGAFFIGILYMTGLYYRIFWMYYIGSIAAAIYWLRAVYLDVTQSKSQAQMLKEQLQTFIRNGEDNLQPRLINLMASIEHVSQGNLSHYKLKIRELIDTLTDSMILAGGDPDKLLARNQQKLADIQKSEDADTLRRIVTSETGDLSKLIDQLPTKRSKQIITQTKCYIEGNFQKNIEVIELAERVFVSPSYLMRCFKKETGKTITQYITECRIEKAKTLLQQNTVSDTAFAVGFNDSNYFGNVFKKLTGLPPQVYKKAKLG